MPPKIFSKIRDVATSESPVSSRLRKYASRVTPNALERRIPQEYKDFLASRTEPHSFRQLQAALALDHFIGLNTAQALLPKRVGNVPVEGIAAEVLRPSNLVPVSKAASLLKGRQFGPPLLRALGMEGAFNAAFSGAETARVGGSPEEVALSTGAGFGLGAITPVGLEALGTAKTKFAYEGVLPFNITRNAPDGSVTSTPPARPTRSQWAKMTPDEKIAASRSDKVTTEATLAHIDKSIELTNDRRNRALERVKTPLERRPFDKKGELKKGGTYLDDFLNIDGNWYTPRLLQADAGETEQIPLITTGKFTLRGKTELQPDGTKVTGSPRPVTISVQGAEVLTELYRDNPNPSTNSIIKALKGISKLPGEEDVTKERALRVKEYIETKAEKVNLRVARPEPADTPLLRENRNSLQSVNAQISRMIGIGSERNYRELNTISGGEMGQVQKNILDDRRRIAKVETVDDDVTASRKVKLNESVTHLSSEIGKLKQRQQDIRTALNKTLENIAFKKDPTLGEPDWVEPLDVKRDIKGNVDETIAQQHERLKRNTDKYWLDEAGNVGAEVAELEKKLESARVELNLLSEASPVVPKAVEQRIRTRLAQNEAKLAAQREELNNYFKQRGDVLQRPVEEVPVDPAEQLAFLKQAYGESVDNQPPILSSMVAKERLQGLLDEQERVTKKYTDLVAKGDDELADYNALRDVVKGQNLRIGEGLLARAKNLYRLYKEHLNLRDTNPAGINDPMTATESLSNYARLAEVGAYVETLGTKGKANWTHSILRNLARRIPEVHLDDNGRARAFIMQDGKKVYGHIKHVAGIGANANDWQVDFLPEFNPSRGVIPGVTIKDITLEYKKSAGENAFDGLSRRHVHELDIIASSREEEMVRVGRDKRGDDVDEEWMRRLVDVRQQNLSGMSPLHVKDANIVTKEELQHNVEEAWAEFAGKDGKGGVLIPLTPDMPDSPSEQVKLIADGWNVLVNLPTPKGELRAAQTHEARQRLIDGYRQHILDTSGMAIDDPGMHLIVDEKGDPAVPFMQYLARSVTPEAITQESSMVNALWSGPRFRKLRGAINFVHGRVFSNDSVRGINANYHNAREGFAANISWGFDGLTHQLRKLAVSLIAETGHPRTSVRPKWMRFSFGDSELEAVFQKHFNPDAKRITQEDTKAGLAAIERLTDDQKGIALDHISRQQRFFVDYPELWSDLPDDFYAVSKAGISMIKRTSDIAEALGGPGVSQGYLNRMMLDPRVHDFIDAKMLSEGHPLSVIAAAVKASSEHGLNAREMLVSGDNLLRAEPLAHFNSALMHNVTDQVKRLMDTDAKFESDDITHIAGRWSIKSLDKWKVRKPDGMVDWLATKDLQDSLKDLENGFNRLPDWKGLAKVSQQIAKVVLSADANIVSVQGYVGFSSKALHELSTGNVKAIGEYANGLRGIMSDEGFHAWYRTHAEDIQYLSSIGALKVGQEAFIAGPLSSKMPLEWMPILGKGMKGIGSFNDLQFNRILLFLKYNAIEHNLEKAKIFRKLGPTSSQFFMRGLLGMKGVAETAGGDAGFYHGQPEHVIRSVGRTVANKFGGVDLNAQGIAQWRQTAEQIMTITPGFLRSQAGMVSTALSRPHSVEGWLAITGIAEEVLFAAGVATAIAAATGNLDKLNLTDMTKADWMAVPFEGSYIPIIPRVGIPRMAARIMKEVIDSAEGEGFEPSQAIKAFAQGRLSPAVNAVLPVLGITDEDFLGRRYKDKKDRYFASLTSFMPIFAENIATDAKEGVAQEGWSSLTPLAYQTPLQFMGKNVVPRPPVDKLNEIATQYTSSQGGPPRQWFDLTRPEQEKLLQNPKTKAAFDDYEYFNQRRQSPKEQQIEFQFKNSEARVDTLRTQPVRFPDGKMQSMTDLYQLLQAGEIDGDEYRKKYQFVNGQINTVMDGMKINLDRLGFDLNAKHDERVKRLKQIFKGSDTKTILTQLAVWDSEQIQPDNYTEDVTIQTPNGPVTFQETDWEEYQQDKNAVLEKYSDDIKLSVLSVTDKWDDEGVDAYRESSKLRTEIEKLPRYRGLDNTQAEKIDAMTKSFRDLNDVVRAKIGLPGSVAPLPKGMGQAIRAVAIKQFVKEGFIKTNEDVKLASIAMLMQDEPKIREALRGPEQLAALIGSPNVLLFYPYLLGRVPVWLRGRLPTVLQPQFDITNRYEQVSG